MARCTVLSTLLQVRRLTVSRNGRTLCGDLSIDIEPGQRWALLGPNGSGKTTLLHHLAGLRSAPAGSIRLADRPLEDLDSMARARQVSLLLQHSDAGFGASVFDAVLSGRHPYLRPFIGESALDERITRDAIAAIGIEALTERPLTRLSGGELRRVEIARLVAQGTPLSLLDEPFNHLDLAHQARCLQALMSRCASTERALLMSVHDLNLAYRACSHWLILDGDGGWRAGERDSLAEIGLLRQVFGQTLQLTQADDGPLFHASLPPPP